MGHADTPRSSEEPKPSWPFESESSLLLGEPMTTVAPPAHAWESYFPSTIVAEIQGHCMQGLPILPGSFYIQMAVLAATTVYKQPVRRLSGIVFHRLCFVPDPAIRSLRTI